MSEGKISDFIKLWRTNFLQSMEPKFLPLGWRVDHTIERSFGLHSKFSKKNDEEGSEETSPDQKNIGGAGEIEEQTD
jgi:hypothetical protein